MLSEGRQDHEMILDWLFSLIGAFLSEQLCLSLFQYSRNLTPGPFLMLRTHQSLEKDPVCFGSSFPHPGLSQLSFQTLG